MKLRELFSLLEQVRQENNLSTVWLCGGICRDRVLGTLTKQGISDLDITTGDNKVHELSRQVAIELGKNYNIKTRQYDDGHTSIQIGKTKLDFSSNYTIPNIEALLMQKGIKNPTPLQKEMFSRDFTCNALMQSLDLKIIKDPTKMGIQDIKNKVLRSCLSPEITFKSNQNRMIRAVYLAAKLNFKIDKDIIDWMLQNKQFFQQSNQAYNAKMFQKAMQYNKERAISAAKELGIFDLLSKLNIQAQLRRNFDYGEGLVENLDKYKSVADFRKKRRKKRMKDIKKILDTRPK